MYAIRTERTFSAAHAITMGGVAETLHGHDWRVRVLVGGPELDADGLLVDFHALERLLDDVIRPFHNTTLNDVPPFDTMNPTAEAVARFIAESLVVDLPGTIASLTVSVTEAPGCEASFAMEVKP
ncbi:MAG: 6-carboxytetrahydropterin synthase [Phycisphaerales bacterium]|jgi:6-pyruvoyltetrahydropterin/6-carboxytetrahydropterin synthase|nr:6-carboxytetrahydropterin synthase [Phycisphaerales bacterium]